MVALRDRVSVAPSPLAANAATCLRSRVVLRARRTVLRLAAVAALVVLLSGCDLISFTAFPPWLGWVRAEHDLSSVIPDSDGRVRLEAVYNQDSGRRYFALVWESAGSVPDRLILLDDQFRILVVEEERASIIFDTRLFMTVPDGVDDAEVQLGSVRYNPANGVVTNAVRPSGFDPLIDNPAGPVYYAARQQDPTKLDFEPLDTVFALGGATVTVNYFAGALIEVGETSIHRVPGPVLGSREYAILVRLNERVYGRTFTTADVLAPITEFFTDPDIDPFLSEIDVSTARLTPEGILTVTQQNGDPVLQRWDVATYTLRDSFNLGSSARTEGDMPVVFDPLGRFYLLYDQGTRSLYQMERWW